MFDCKIEIENDQHDFKLGDTVRGQVLLTMPLNYPVTSVAVSFRCLGEVNWTEPVGSPYYLNGNVFTDCVYYHKDPLNVDKCNVVILSQNNDRKNVAIPFDFVIPVDKNLPSSMSSEYGFVKYFIGVVIRSANNEEKLKKLSKEISVHSPMQDGLKISVGGTAEKNVVLHGGKVVMHASLDRKGFARGETIGVHVSVDNDTSAVVTPKVSLRQVQIFMSESRHKTVNNVVSGKELISGKDVAPKSKLDQTIGVAIGQCESLSIKSSLVTVKYFVDVTLDIPQSFDLHIELPVVVTKQTDIGKL